MVVIRTAAFGQLAQEPARRKTREPARVAAEMRLVGVAELRREGRKRDLLSPPPLDEREEHLEAQRLALATAGDVAVGHAVPAKNTIANKRLNRSRMTSPQ